MIHGFISNVGLTRYDVLKLLHENSELKLYPVPDVYPANGVVDYLVDLDDFMNITHSGGIPEVFKTKLGLNVIIKDTLPPQSGRRGRPPLSKVFLIECADGEITFEPLENAPDEIRFWYYLDKSDAQADDVHEYNNLFNLFSTMLELTRNGDRFDVSIEKALNSVFRK